MTVVYAGTRNIYHNMTVAAKSLLMHTYVDRVLFLIEDDAFPEALPDVIRCMNVSGQQWFPDSPNTRKRWSYMSLMRLALPEILRDEDTALWMDVDTIVHKDITPLLQTSLDGCYFGAAEEPIRSARPFVYYNTGVLLMNLRMLRDGKYKELIDLVNRKEMAFPDQDAVNLLCQTKIKAIDPYYNSNRWIVEVSDPAVTHFAADRNYERRELWQQYEKMEWRVKDADEI